MSTHLPWARPLSFCNSLSRLLTLPLTPHAVRCWADFSSRPRLPPVWSATKTPAKLGWDSMFSTPRRAAEPGEHSWVVPLYPAGLLPLPSPLTCSGISAVLGAPHSALWAVDIPSSQTGRWQTLTADSGTKAGSSLALQAPEVTMNLVLVKQKGHAREINYRCTRPG